MTQTNRVTVVNSSEDNPHVNDLRIELEKQGLGVDVIDFDPVNSLREEMKKLGDVTIWRQSSLHNHIQRPSVESYLDNTFMINEAVFLRPNVSEKYYQQQALAATPVLRDYAIPTFRVKNKRLLKTLLDKHTLSFPVIAKPNNGYRGEGIVLVYDISDLSKLELGVGNYVFQQFIPNDGDWRVIIVGGKPVGAMKRIAQEGSYLNNISQGANAVKEDDNDILRLLYKLAPKVAALFHLRFCGVDIIRDTRTGEYKILEVNTVPQWLNERGFTATTGVSVAKELSEYVKEVLDWKQSKDLPSSIDRYFKNSLELYPNDLFHFASRRWLWSHDKWALEILTDMKSWYIGSSEDEHRKKISAICSRSEAAQNVNQRRKYRQKYYERHQDIPLYNTLLFRYLFAKTLYDVDLRPYIQEQVSDDEFMKAFERLQKDHDAMRVLSTHAVNYIYLLRNYLNIEIDPQLFLDISDGYDRHSNDGELDDYDTRKLKIYLLTHAIIGESQFYAKPVRGEVYIEMCRRVEQMIEDHYFKISLDNKLEFLVCAALCGYETKLRSIVLQEAEQSTSWAGPFLVDRDAPDIRHIVQTSEHRNILYIMASETEEFIKSGENIYVK